MEVVQVATLNTKILLRNDTLANWITHDPVLLKGEFSVAYDDNGKAHVKIGNGVQKWSELDFFAGEANEVYLSVDNNSLVIDNDVIKIRGFDAAEVGSTPVKGEDGTLIWVKSGSEIVEDLQETIGSKEDGTGLAGDVAKLESVVGQPAGEAPATGIFAEVQQIDVKVTNLQSIIGTPSTSTSTGTGLIAKIESKADASAVYTKEETEQLVSKSIANVDHLKRQIVGSIEEIDLGIPGVENYIFMVPASESKEHNTYDEYMVINGHVEKVGNWEVDLSDYAKISDVNSLKDIVNTKLSKEESLVLFQQTKYEIVSKPIGTLVSYKDGEIRVMCPADTDWANQPNVPGEDINLHYIGFRAYAPTNAASFKVDLKETIQDQTMHYFEGNDLAGIDEYGRKYSMCWIGVASYNEVSHSWSYYGATSTAQKFIGWYYSIEWYNAQGIRIDSDCIRINLSNESCHSLVEPYYVLTQKHNPSAGLLGVAINGSLLSAVDGIVNIPKASESLFGVVRSSEGMNKIRVLEDGTMEVVNLSFDRVVSPDGSDKVIIGGGGAQD